MTELHQEYQQIATDLTHAFLRIEAYVRDALNNKYPDHTINFTARNLSDWNLQVPEPPYEGMAEEAILDLVRAGFPFQPLVDAISELEDDAEDLFDRMPNNHRDWHALSEYLDQAEKLSCLSYRVHQQL